MTVYKSTTKPKRHTEQHGMSRTNVYYVWRNIKARCNNPKIPGYKYYGGRGISLCDAWLSFSRFFADMGPRPSPAHTVERIDNDRGYYPDNCKWALPPEQSRNTRRTHFITYRGKTQCIQDWADELGVSEKTISERIRQGWSDSDAVSIRPQTKHSNHRLIEYKGRTQTVTAWAAEYGFAKETLFYRLNHGWPIEKALQNPVRTAVRHKSPPHEEHGPGVSQSSATHS